MPKGGLSTLQAAQSDDEKLAILADQFDMVMNGYEICSGGVRTIIQPYCMKYLDC